MRLFAPTEVLLARANFCHEIVQVKKWNGETVKAPVCAVLEFVVLVQHYVFFCKNN